jgi:hypothetical protein
VGASGVTDAYAPTCTGGSLGLSAFSSVAFGSVTLNGLDQTTTTTGSLTPDDETGSGSGWNVTVFASAWSDGRGNSLPASTVTAASVSAAGGNCSLPANSVGYPTAGFGTSAGTATKVYDAGAGTGSGPSTVTLTFSQRVPANQKIGAPSPDSFSSTWTFTIATGP